MKLTIPKVNLKEEPDKIYPLIEFMWHTLMPLMFAYVGLQFNSIFLVFILLSFIRIRPDQNDKT